MTEINNDRETVQRTARKIIAKINKSPKFIDTSEHRRFVVDKERDCSETEIEIHRE